MSEWAEVVGRKQNSSARPMEIAIRKERRTPHRFKPLGSKVVENRSASVQLPKRGQGGAKRTAGRTVSPTGQKALVRKHPRNGRPSLNSKKRGMGLRRRNPVLYEIGWIIQ